MQLTREIWLPFILLSQEEVAFTALVMLPQYLPLIAYGEECRIHDLPRREFCFGTKDTVSVTQNLIWPKFYYSEKGTEKASDIDIRRGRRVPPLTSSDVALYTFSIGY